MIHVGDGTWNLRVFITDLRIDKTLRVKGDLHVGGVMLKLVGPGWLNITFTNIQKKLYLYLCQSTHLTTINYAIEQKKRNSAIIKLVINLISPLAFFYFVFFLTWNSFFFFLTNTAQNILFLLE